MGYTDVNKMLPVRKGGLFQEGALRWRCENMCGVLLGVRLLHLPLLLKEKTPTHPFPSRSCEDVKSSAHDEIIAL